MNREELYDGITDIRENCIERAQAHTFRKRKPRRRIWITSAAALFIVAVLIAVLHPHFTDTYVTAGTIIAEAEYPEMTQYPEDGADYEEYYKALLAQRRYPKAYAEGLEDFLAASVPTFLSGADGENAVYSPLNTYMALAMLAELTGGESRQQILTLLGTDDMDDLRTQATAIWTANYCDEGTATSILASSLWLSEDIDYIPSTMDTLAEIYYASSYRGEMGSDAFNQALQSWVNEQTGGLLEDSVSDLKLDADTVISLVATVYFKARWEDVFWEGSTAPDTFHSPGGDVTCSFMHGEADRYCAGEHFTAVSKCLTTIGNMYFVLPEEGMSPEELLADEEALSLIASAESADWDAIPTINFSVPKFDVSSSFDLSSGLKVLGVTDVFSPGEADFTPSVSNADGDFFLSQTKQAVRVLIDEEGCTAASFTMIDISEEFMPQPEEIDFVLDRPFLFFVAGPDGLPLFVGIVNQP